MSTALTPQQLAARILEAFDAQGVVCDHGHEHLADTILAAMEQYHREASQLASVEPVAFMTSDKKMLVFADRAIGPTVSMYPLYTAPPDTDALRKRVAELEAEVERLRGIANDILRLTNDAMLDANRGGSEYDREETVAEFKAALAARKEG